MDKDIIKFISSLFWIALLNPSVVTLTVLLIYEHFDFQGIKISLIYIKVNLLSLKVTDNFPSIIVSSWYVT